MRINLLDFNKAKVLVVGDVMLDRYWYGFTERISPEAPVPVVEVNNVEEKPGGAANVAMNVKSLGAKSKLIGIAGKDNAYDIIKNKLVLSKIDCQLIKLKNYSTIIKLRVMSKNQQLIRLDFEKKINNINYKLIFNKVLKCLTNFNAVILSDYNKGVLNKNLKVIIEKARKNKIHVLVDPKGNDFSKYRGATILTPNIHEFESVVGKCHNNKEIIQNGLDLIDKLNLSALLITQSEHGMTLLQAGNKKTLYFPAQAKKVFDVTGAGDTVIGVLAVSLSSGKSLEESCLIANIAAAISVGKLGTATVNKKDIKKYFSFLKKNNFSIINQKQLKKEVKKHKAFGNKIVMTNGFFDVVNSKHIFYLSNAKKFGDKLIVAINSDISIKKIKKSKKNVNSLINRMILLGSLNLIDWIVSFDEEKPIKLIEQILPDVLVTRYSNKSEDIVIGDKKIWDSCGNIYALNLEDNIVDENNDNFNFE